MIKSLTTHLSQAFVTWDAQISQWQPRRPKAADFASTSTTSTTNASSSFSASQQNSPEVLNPTSPKSSRADGHGNWFSFSESRFGFFEKLVGKDSPVKRLWENKDRRVAPKPEKRFEDKKGRSSPKVCCPSSATEPSSPYGSSRVQSPPLGEKPVFHSQHASPVSASWSARERYSDWDCSSLYTGGYGYGCAESLTSFHSTPGSQRGGPRSRSRIRTNPWLPSPRPSLYSARSLSPPCTSSRSPSPSSSPAPPSSSDSTSPLTSFSSDVNAKRESQLQRHRRHRRHHSEVKASELTRHIGFDFPLTDTEQYYSTLDSGIGDTAASSSPGEKDKHKVASSRKQRNSKRRSVERDLELVKNLASSSPKSKPKFRSKNRSTHQSSTKGLIANRDSKFWDSDSSSRSPPRSCRSLNNSKHSLHFENFHSENCVVSSRSPRLSGTPREAVPGFLPGDFYCEPDSLDFCPVSGSHQSSVLSLCDDICIITSNIEQLAQNISSEYEEGLDGSSQPVLDGNSKQEQKQDSLRELYNLDVEHGSVTHQLDSDLCSALNYNSFAGPLQCTLLRAEEGGNSDALQNDTSTDSLQTDLSSHDDTSTVDVAVQTDFADDDDEEEDVSLSDWLTSAESCSDWVASNGSGSDWPTSGGSDWHTGEGTMTTTDEKLSKISDSEVTKSELPSSSSSSSDVANSNSSGAIPKTRARQNLSTYTPPPPSSEVFEKCGEANAQRISCKVEFNITGGNCHCSRNIPSSENEKNLPARSRAKSDHCLDDMEFLLPKGRGEEQRSRSQQTSRGKGERRSNYDHVVPYPYDVRRFSDAILPCDEREGSISPCFYDSYPSKSDEAETFSRADPLTSTPLFQENEPEDDFFLRFPTSMTSESHDVTTRDEASSTNPDDRRFESCHTPAVAIPQFRNPLLLRPFEDLPCTGRPLHEVKASLESEVEVLRQGRRLVSRKIREAREEEMVRQQQKLRFQRLLDIHRKRILLETLQGLRHRLESQSTRLQTSYSAVLSLQKRGV
ncbi:hypothetical protein ACOMHN_054660 [Nucella lapillus]